MKLTFIDWIIMLVYFAFVLGVGWALKRYMKTSTDFSFRPFDSRVDHRSGIHLGKPWRSGSDWHGYLKLRFDEQTRGFNAIVLSAVPPRN